MQAQSTEKSLLEQAWDLMMGRDQDRASVRNQIGWNGGDSGWAHRVDRYRFAYWPDAMVDELVEKLEKYDARQLTPNGISYAQIKREHAERRYYRSNRQAWKNVQAQAMGETKRDEFVAATKPATCCRCHAAINVGEVIGFRKGERGGWDRFHKTCPSAAPAIVVPAAVATPEVVAPPDGDNVRASIEYLNKISVNHVEVDAPLAPVSSALTARDVLGPNGTIARSLPTYEHRPQQLEMAEVIERQIVKGHRADFDSGEEAYFAHVLAEMGTGTGKSFGYIVPAVLSGKRVLVSTAVKALQEQLLDKDLPFLQQHMGRPFSYAIIKGRSNYVCLHMLNQSKKQSASGEALFRMPEDADLFDRVTEWVGTDECERVNADLDAFGEVITGGVRELVTVDSDGCLGKKCPLFDTCYVERQKSAAAGADVIVANHALLMIDAKLRDKSSGYVGVLPEVDVLVVDEAHRLEEVATNSLGEELNETRYGRLMRRLDRMTVKHPSARGNDEWQSDAAAYMALANDGALPYNEIFHTLRTRLEEARDNQQLLGDERRLAQPVLAAVSRLTHRMRGGLDPEANVERQVNAAPEWLSGAEREQWVKLTRGFGEFSAALKTVSDPSDPDMWCRYAEMENGRGDRARVTLLCKPIDVSEPLGRMIFHGYPSVILTSATMADADGFAYIKSRVGLIAEDLDIAELIAGSPFDYERNSVLYVPDDIMAPVTKPGPDQDRYFALVASRMTGLLLSSGGRAFCLFTSATALRRVLPMVAEKLPSNWRIMSQLSVGAYAATTRRVVIDAFKDRERLYSEPPVLFGLKTYFEGVDLQGELLEMVIIDKIPFPTAGDPLFRAKCDKIDRKYGHMASFDKLTLPEAITTLKQAVGRLIRTKRDRGVCAVLDVRLATKGYGKKIVSSLPPMRRSQNAAVISSVYKQGAQ